jgi:hypothetical protein
MEAPYHGVGCLDTENLGHSLIDSVSVGSDRIGEMDYASPKWLSPEEETQEDDKVALASWNAAAGPLAVQLFGLRCDMNSLFSLLDKDTVRYIIHNVYPKPKPKYAHAVPVATKNSTPFVPLLWWFNRGIEPAFPPYHTSAVERGPPDLYNAAPIAQEWGQLNVSLQLSRTGDLLQNRYLNIDLPAISAAPPTIEDGTPNGSDIAGHGDIAEEAMPINDLFE